MSGRIAAGLSAALLVLVACGPREEILAGERLDLRALDGATEAAGPVVAPPLRLPAPVTASTWGHTNGDPSHLGRHAVLSASPQLAWSTPIGADNARKRRITAAPVSDGARVYTLDALAGVMAVDARSGAPIWRRDLTPARDDAEDASGGGLAVSGGRLFVTTAFGELVAIDAATGRELWTQRLQAAATGTPAVLGDLVYTVGRDGTGWAVAVDDGRVEWEITGNAGIAGLVGPAGPAVSDRMVIFPFGSGDLVAAFRRGGVRIWQAAVTGTRLGRAYAGITDITGAPVIDGDRVYAGNASGRIVALTTGGGERIWTAKEGAVGPVWPAGGSVFAVTDAGTAVRLDAETGAALWTTELPYLASVRGLLLRRSTLGIFAHYGPVLAGGRLLVAGSDGVIRQLDPQDGRIVGGIAIPGGATTPPIVVGGVMYIVSGDGRLLAYR